MDPSHSTPAQRAGDADREAAAETLRHAAGDGRLSVEEMEQRMSAVFSARTHPELDALLADLQGRQALSAPAGRLGTNPSADGQQRSSLPETHHTRTIMSESKLRGFWRPAADSQVTTVMGESSIDLTEADLSRPVTRMRIVTLMGSVRIDLPDDINVHVTKLTILAENDVMTPDRPPLPGAPELHIRLVTIMGEAKVRFGRRRERRNELYA